MENENVHLNAVQNHLRLIRVMGNGIQYEE